MVGFNRRHSPAIEAVRGHFEATGRPLVVTYRVNAGQLPPAHWYNDRPSRRVASWARYATSSTPCSAIVEAPRVVRVCRGVRPKGGFARGGPGGHAPLHRWIGGPRSPMQQEDMPRRPRSGWKYWAVATPPSSTTIGGCLLDDRPAWRGSPRQRARFRSSRCSGRC